MYAKLLKITQKTWIIIKNIEETASLPPQPSFSKGFKRIKRDIPVN
jgi:hypothetical protein